MLKNRNDYKRGDGTWMLYEFITPTGQVYVGYTTQKTRQLKYYFRHQAKAAAWNNRADRRTAALRECGGEVTIVELGTHNWEEDAKKAFIKRVRKLVEDGVDVLNKRFFTKEMKGAKNV